MKTFAAFDQYIEHHHDEFVGQLKTFAAQPSVSATGEGIEKMAELTKETMESLGAEVQLLEVAPNEPKVVYASLGQGEKTLLIYNHYDVQPPEPLELWESPPFEPTLRNGKLYGRGVSDDKGQIMYRVQAVRAWQETFGELPLKINWFIEGEEETGSPNLEPFCMANAHLLKADGCLWETGGVDEVGRPVLSLGAKGLLYVELSVESMPSDQHSAYGTIVPNAAWRLNWALSTLKAPDETILIEGLMDNVLPPNEVDMELLKAIPFEEEKMKATLGVDQWIAGVAGFEALKRHLFAPTCTICGIESGYTGEGSKTVLPARAKAKVGFRLVPNQTPKTVAYLLRRHLDEHGFEDIQMKILSGEHPGKSDPSAEVIQAAIAAAREVYQTEPVVYPLMAGTGPVWPIAVAHGTPLVNLGASYPGAKVHAPNENLVIDNYFWAMRAMGRFIANFGKR